MFANCQRGGCDQAVSDVCKAPAPTTFVNIASGSLAVPTAPTILFAGMPAHNMTTLIPVSQGDEAGVLGGVISNVILGPSRHLTGCSTLLLQGSPATRMGSTTLQNLNNAPGVRLTPSQTTIELLAR
ncbi:MULTISPECIES: DUF4150 domain-containing protein [Pantoea]|jgi:hypothetical protein|uniref:DUF4150 domain-containing protein n=1 Tax=Pantoea piersonii TaxID=2364647 RepID=A0AAJ5QPQ3_9GAMM|nr:MULTISPECIES: DUF4150 domain-containing protein [Pantoea]MDU6431551.1 DUF4150 domain-containing protein [Pantoea sp.]MBZ6384293.1 DUF4150 domain-containing protein [Pantoea piersonii]MBZ6398555.1 DUF4150 domain-containing protein [Pantoea piersonii]MBZ6406446.1 DUF4150 domain-containing protein [Pantoea piersonii]NYB02637.1 DUF4150 domain-containing protein [Pantoea piersonii]